MLVMSAHGCYMPLQEIYVEKQMVGVVSHVMSSLSDLRSFIHTPPESSFKAFGPIIAPDSSMRSRSDGIPRKQPQEKNTHTPHENIYFTAGSVLLTLEPIFAHKETLQDESTNSNMPSNGA